ncbi:MAG: carboxymuconolactone decarboxylase family protein [Chloroflexota bacterium]
MPVVPYVEQPEDQGTRDLYERLSKGPLGNINLFRVVAHNSTLLRDWLCMASPLLMGGLLLEPRLREIAILRVAQNVRSEYEFGQHISIARAAGVTDEEIAGLRDYEATDLFSDLERALIRYVDAVQRFDADSPEHARELRRWLSDRELVELSFAIGHWTMVACVLIPLEVPLDEHIETTLPEGWREWL